MLGPGEQLANRRPWPLRAESCGLMCADRLEPIGIQLNTWCGPKVAPEAHACARRSVM